MDVHRRYNPLRNSWVLCSPHRTSRPWQGAQEEVASDFKPAHDPKCYLCPGNSRAGGETNPTYDSTFVFINDYAAVKPVTGDVPDYESSELFRAEHVSGQCLVVCFSPKHNVTLAHMSQPELVGVIEAWQHVYETAKSTPGALYCQIFENKGSAMGCSNPHPHGQAWITSIVPDEPALEHEMLLKYHKKHGRHMLEDYVERELAFKERIIDENDTFVVLVPYWATWPFETMILSKKRIPNVGELDDKAKDDLADSLSRLTRRYDNLFKTSFPYSMGLHQSFIGGSEPDVEHLLFHFYPPLLRSATVKKFLVGYELLAMPQRDITAESATASLRAQAIERYA